MGTFLFSDGAGTPNQFTFSTASNVVVNHSLGYFPIIWILDDQQKEIYGDVTYNSLSTFTVVFQISISGVIYYR